MAKRTPIKAIRAKCLECCNDQVAEVRMCPCADCALWAYRMGHRPKDGEIIDCEVTNRKTPT
ncbi:MAG: hypothetical protein LUE29_08145 [Lachnospiraceae bacterium]|nr:hypothetical protein [Lachnospiraceae bacterium]